MQLTLILRQASWKRLADIWRNPRHCQINLPWILLWCVVINKPTFRRSRRSIKVLETLSSMWVAGSIHREQTLSNTQWTVYWICLLLIVSLCVCAFLYKSHSFSSPFTGLFIILTSAFYCSAFYFPSITFTLSLSFCSHLMSSKIVLWLHPSAIDKTITAKNWMNRLLFFVNEMSHSLKMVNDCFDRWSLNNSGSTDTRSWWQRLRRWSKNASQKSRFDFFPKQKLTLRLPCFFSWVDWLRWRRSITGRALRESWTTSMRLMTR